MSTQHQTEEQDWLMVNESAQAPVAAAANTQSAWGETANEAKQRSTVPTTVTQGSAVLGGASPPLSNQDRLKKMRDEFPGPLPPLTGNLARDLFMITTAPTHAVLAQRVTAAANRVAPTPESRAAARRLLEERVAACAEEVSENARSAESTTEGEDEEKQREHQHASQRIVGASGAPFEFELRPIDRMVDELLEYFESKPSSPDRAFIVHRNAAGDDSIISFLLGPNNKSMEEALDKYQAYKLDPRNEHIAARVFTRDPNRVS